MIPYDLYVQHDHLGNAPELLAPADAARVNADRPDWFRASGACVCEACGKLYYDHPPVLGAIWLTRLCDDTFVKL